MTSTTRALVFGGTGGTGRHIVRWLDKLTSEEKNAVAFVRLFSRRPFGPPLGQNARMDEIVLAGDDFAAQLDAHAADMHNFDVAFCALGTTRSQAGSSEAFRAIDFDLVVKIARLCREAGVSDFHLISASNADSGSWFLYPRVKGDAEAAVKAVGFPHLSIYRPSLLITTREKARPLEALGRAAMSVDFGHRLSIPVELLAAAMVSRALDSGTYAEDACQTVAHGECVRRGAEAAKKWKESPPQTEAAPEKDE